MALIQTLKRHPLLTYFVLGAERLGGAVFLLGLCGLGGVLSIRRSTSSSRF